MVDPQPKVKTPAQIARAKRKSDARKARTTTPNKAPARSTLKVGMHGINSQTTEATKAKIAKVVASRKH